MILVGTFMIDVILDSDLSPDQLAVAIKSTDMTAEVNHLIERLHQQIDIQTEINQKGLLLDATNVHTGTVTLFFNDKGNISLKAPDSTPPFPQLYSIPGYSVLFAINGEAYPVQLYALEGDQLTRSARVIVDAEHPLLIDGAGFLYDSNPDGKGHPAFIGSVNLPDRTMDIHVFDRASLLECAWFPHDNSAARYLVSLNLLEAIQDPDRVKVAEELIYHYHPAVAWNALLLMYRAAPDNAHRHVAQLRKFQNARINALLDLYEGKVA